MKKMLALMAFLCLQLSTRAQDFDHYRAIQSAGPVPDAFTVSSTDKYKSEILNIEKDLRAREKREQKQFYLETNFMIDDLLLSGKVLFGSELNKYVEAVADKLLVNEPELKKKVQFFIVRSPSVNAFTTQQGYVFINMGLLAQLESEAQLAFILAHELIHVKNQHHLNMYLESKNIDRNSASAAILKQADFDDALVAKNRYSKELEFEADNGGLELYLKTNYSLSEIAGVFDVLRYAHILFDIEEFDRHFFDKGSLVLPERLFLDSTRQIEAINDSNDIVSTHPATNKRLEKIQQGIENKDNSGRQAYLISKERFQKNRKIARFELVQYYLHYFRFEEALYTTFLLLKEHPDSEFLHLSMLQALHAMSKFLTEEAIIAGGNYTNGNSKYFERIEGPLQNVYHLSTKISAKELNVITLRYAWELNNKFPDNKTGQKILADLCKDLTYYYEDHNQFKAVSKEEAMELIAKDLTKAEVVDSSKNSVDSSSQAPLSKYDKIRAQQQEKAKEEELKPNNLLYLDFAFGDIIENPEFKAALKDGKEKWDEEKKRQEYYSTPEGKKELERASRRISRRGYQFGIDSVMILNPYYLQLDTRKLRPYRFIDSETGQQEMHNSIKKSADASGLHYVLLDAYNVESNQADVFNEAALLNDWMAEQHSMGSGKMPGFKQDEVEQLIEKYGTRYVVRIGMITIIAPPKQMKTMEYLGPIALGTSFSMTVMPLLSVVTSSVGVLAAGFIIPIVATSVYFGLRPMEYTLYFSVVYDLKNLDYQVINYQMIKKKASPTLQKSYMYNTFHQIKSKKK